MPIFTHLVTEFVDFSIDKAQAAQKLRGIQQPLLVLDNRRQVFVQSKLNVYVEIQAFNEEYTEWGSNFSCQPYLIIPYSVINRFQFLSCLLSLDDLIIWGLTYTIEATIHLLLLVVVMRQNLGF